MCELFTFKGCCLQLLCLFATGNTLWFTAEQRGERQNLKICFQFETLKVANHRDQMISKGHWVKLPERGCKDEHKDKISIYMNTEGMQKRNHGDKEIQYEGERESMVERGGKC